jgi:predicted RNA polymerase sigma factor
LRRLGRRREAKAEYEAAADSAPNAAARDHLSGQARRLAVR